jgi:hypothetical protein
MRTAQSALRPARKFVGVESLEPRRLFSAAPAWVPPAPPPNPIVNGGFENPVPLAGWTVDGNATTAGVEYLPPPAGASQAVLATGQGGFAGTPDTAAKIESFLSLTPGTLSKQGNGAATSGSAIKQTFTATGFDILSFKADYLTNETNNQDFAFVTLTNANGRTQFFKIRPPVHASSALDAGNTNENSESGYETYYLLIPHSGSWTVGFGVVNTVTSSILTSLAVDSVSVTPLFDSFGVVSSGFPYGSFLIGNPFDSISCGNATAAATTATPTGSIFDPGANF